MQLHGGSLLFIGEAITFVLNVGKPTLSGGVTTLFGWHS
jgi:hypothetical protein